MGGKEAEADAAMAKGDKLTKPTFMRFKPDWARAQAAFEEAGGMYRACGAKGKAVSSYERASDCCERIDSPWHAAKHLETALVLSRDTEDWKQVSTFARRAALLYAEAGRAATGGEVLVKGGQALEDGDTDEAASLYMEAFEIFEEEGRGALAGDAYRAAISMQIRNQRWAEAVATLLKFGQACEKSKSTNSQCKAYLSAIVVWLYAGDAVEANSTYQDCIQIDAFLESDEGRVADRLLSAYSTGDVEQIKGVTLGNAAFKHLDTSVARLAKKLPTGDVKKMADVLADGVLSRNSDDESDQDGDLDDEDDLC